MGLVSSYSTPPFFYAYLAFMSSYFRSSTSLSISAASLSSSLNRVSLSIFMRQLFLYLFSPSFSVPAGAALLPRTKDPTFSASGFHTYTLQSNEHDEISLSSSTQVTQLIASSWAFHTYGIGMSSAENLMSSIFYCTPVKNVFCYIGA